MNSTRNKTFLYSCAKEEDKKKIYLIFRACLQCHIPRNRPSIRIKKTVQNYKCTPVKYTDENHNRKNPWPGS